MPSDQQTVIPLREGPDRQQHRESVRKGVCVGLQEEEEEGGENLSKASSEGG